MLLEVLLAVKNHLHLLLPFQASLRIGFPLEWLNFHLDAFQCITFMPIVMTFLPWSPFNLLFIIGLIRFLH